MRCKMHVVIKDRGMLGTKCSGAERIFNVVIGTGNIRSIFSEISSDKMSL